MFPPTLYQRLLGPDFERLPPVLRSFHQLPQGGSAVGIMNVRRSQGWLQRLTARLLGLPPSGQKIPATLRVDAGTSQEVWRRRFGDFDLASRQWQEGPQLVEQIGPLRFVFSLTANRRGMTFRFQHNSLAFEPRWRFRWLRVAARVTADTSSWHVRVVVSVPILGRLTTYEGHMRPLS